VIFLCQGKGLREEQVFAPIKKPNKQIAKVSPKVHIPLLEEKGAKLLPLNRKIKQLYLYSVPGRKEEAFRLLIQF
jgi:hypothetical protein